MFETLKAVSYLHNQEPPIIHRDIKPENILFTGKTVKLADFGWSNTRDIIRSTYCGTRDYLAPEMILKKGHDEKLDVWTLGVLMYEVCTGKTPFAPQGIIKRPEVVRNELEENILKKQPEYPNFLSMNARDLINQLLEKKPEDRPSCTQALKHPWFRVNGFRYNAEKERVLYNIISKSKKQLNRKKIRRLLSQDKKGDPVQSRRLNKTDNFENLKNSNFENTSRTEESPSHFESLKQKIVSKTKQRKRKKNMSIDEMTLNTLKIYSSKDPTEAVEELSTKYTIANEEKNQLAKVLKIKSEHIKELEEEIKDLKNKVVYKKNGEVYSKSEILFMEGQTRMSHLTQKRVEELEEKFDNVVKENSKLIEKSREFRISEDFKIFEKSENSKKKIFEVEDEFKNIGILLKELNTKLEKKNFGNNYEKFEGVVNQEEKKTTF